jgi:hypothetical protein
MTDIMRETYRPLSEGESLQILTIKRLGREFYNFLTETSRENSLAKTKIEEAVMWATKGVTRHE